MGNVLNKNLKGKNYYEVEPKLLQTLYEDYHERIDDHQYSSIEELLIELAKGVTDSALTAVRLGLARKEDEKQRGVGVLDQYDLACLAAYIDFARAHKVLGDHEKIQVEIREEERKLYVLLPLTASLIHSVSLTTSKPSASVPIPVSGAKPAGEGASPTPSSEGIPAAQDKRAYYLWVHSEDWAKQRFVNKASGPYLCGQFMGSSKFVSLSSGVPKTKEQALEALGLKGYEAFDRPGEDLYVVEAAVSDEILAATQPMIPLIYKSKQESVPQDEKGAPDGDRKEQSGETTSYEWILPDNFGANTIPGFTSGGKSEVVIHTFEVDAKDLDDLRSKGVSVARLSGDKDIVKK